MSCPVTLGHASGADQSLWSLALAGDVDACDLDSPRLDCGSRGRLSSLMTVLMSCDFDD